MQQVSIQKYCSPSAATKGTEHPSIKRDSLLFSLVAVFDPNVICINVILVCWFLDLASPPPLFQGPKSRIASILRPELKWVPVDKNKIWQPWRLDTLKLEPRNLDFA